MPGSDAAHRAHPGAPQQPSRAAPALPRLQPPLRVVLVNPLIPPNTGNVARTCAVTGSELHLVGPLGFSLDDASLRRAGLDYWEALAPAVHRDWAAFEAAVLVEPQPRLHLFTSGASRSLFEIRFAPGDCLVFGQEQLGLPPALLAAWPDRQVAIPMRPGQRSLNLAVAAGVAIYAAFGSMAG